MLYRLTGSWLGLGLENLRVRMDGDGLNIRANGDGFTSKTLFLDVLECAVIGESRHVCSAINRL